jgi:hypothetical protein
MMLLRQSHLTLLGLLSLGLLSLGLLTLLLLPLLGLPPLLLLEPLYRLYLTLHLTLSLHR